MFSGRGSLVDALRSKLQGNSSTFPSDDVFLLLMLNLNSMDP